MAYQRQIGDAARPGIVFLCGYGTDMTGSKATYLADRCAREDISFVRFDYRGCGASAGDFRDGTIGAWLDDALTVFDALTTGPQIIVGSSMGGWLGLLLAQRRTRVAAFVGIAAAPDFTEELIWKNLIDAQKARLAREGELYNDAIPRDQQRPISARLIYNARDYLILDKPLSLPIPVRLLQGLRDREVPWQHAVRLANHITGDDVRITLCKNGDHRLSQPEDLALLWTTIADLFKPRN